MERKPHVGDRVVDALSDYYRMGTVTEIAGTMAHITWDPMPADVVVPMELIGEGYGYAYIIRERAKTNRKRSKR